MCILVSLFRYESIHPIFKGFSDINHVTIYLLLVYCSPFAKLVNYNTTKRATMEFNNFFIFAPLVPPGDPCFGTRSTPGLRPNFAILFTDYTPPLYPFSPYVPTLDILTYSLSIADMLSRQICLYQVCTYLTGPPHI